MGDRRKIKMDGSTMLVRVISYICSYTIRFDVHPSLSPDDFRFPSSTETIAKRRIRPSSERLTVAGVLLGIPVPENDTWFLRRHNS